MSKSFQFSSYDLKSIGIYLLVIFATGLLANLSGLQDILTNYIGVEFSGLVISMLGIAIKKFIQDYSK